MIVSIEQAHYFIGQWFYLFKQIRVTVFRPNIISKRKFYRKFNFDGNNRFVLIIYVSIIFTTLYILIMFHQMNL